MKILCEHLNHVRQDFVLYNFSSYIFPCGDAFCGKLCED